MLNMHETASESNTLSGTDDSVPLFKTIEFNVYYDRAHVVQDVSFELTHGVFGIVGRNGMGKTSLCNGITGVGPALGEVRLKGQDICGLEPYCITRKGISYVPQGRRLWGTLTVDEHLKLAASRRAGRWNIDEIYTLFPRLSERRAHLGRNLSGGEQQMVAIARALLLNPVLMVMDEPTEGLAPVIVKQMVELFRKLAENGLPILLIEQNLSVVLAFADQVAVMENGRLGPAIPAKQIREDIELQRSLFGFSDGRNQNPDAARRARDGAV